MSGDAPADRRNFADAALHAADLDHRRRPGTRFHIRRYRAAAAIFAARGLSRGRDPHQSVHARICRRPGDRKRTRRDRRGAADVRRRAAFLARRPALGRAHRHPRRHCADRGRDRPRRRAGVVARLVDQRGRRVRPRLVGRKHGRAAARDAGAALAGDRARAHRGGLADRRRHGDGAGAGAVAGACAGAESRGVPEPVRACSSDRDHAGQGCGVRRHHADRGQARDPLDPALRGAYRLARAVSPVRARHRARRRLRRGDAVRRVVRARCILRRHDAERIRAEPACGHPRRCPCATPSR